MLSSNNPNDPDENGYTPIYKAAELGCNEVIKYLAPLTDNPNAPTNDGSTPIQIASQCRHIESVRILQSYTSREFHFMTSDEAKLSHES